MHMSRATRTDLTMSQADVRDVNSTATARNPSSRVHSRWICTARMLHGWSSFRPWQPSSKGLGDMITSNSMGKEKGAELKVHILL